MAQVALPSSSSLRQPFCWRATPFTIFREEKHCWPMQRWSRSHTPPSHTQDCSLRTGLPANSSVSDERKQMNAETHYSDVACAIQIEQHLVELENMPDFPLTINLFPKDHDCSNNREHNSFMSHSKFWTKMYQFFTHLEQCETNIAINPKTA